MPASPYKRSSEASALTTYSAAAAETYRNANDGTLYQCSRRFPDVRVEMPQVPATLQLERAKIPIVIFRCLERIFGKAFATAPATVRMFLSTFAGREASGPLRLLVVEIQTLCPTHLLCMSMLLVSELFGFSVKTRGGKEDSSDRTGRKSCCALQEVMIPRSSLQVAITERLK